MKTETVNGGSLELVKYVTAINFIKIVLNLSNYSSSWGEIKVIENNL